MTRDEIETWITDTLVESFEVPRERVSLDANLVEDLDLDSLDAIEMMVRLQEVSGQRIDESAVKDLRTLRDLVNLVTGYLSSDSRESVEAGGTTVGSNK